MDMLTEVKIFSPSGALMRHGFKNAKNKYHGEVKEYYANQKYINSVGTLKSIKNYVNGKLQGKQRYYNRNGIIIDNKKIINDENYPITVDEFGDSSKTIMYARDGYKISQYIIRSADEYLRSSEYNIAHSYGNKYHYSFHSNQYNNTYRKRIIDNSSVIDVRYHDNMITMTKSDGILSYTKTISENNGVVNIDYSEVICKNKRIDLIELFGYTNLTTDDISYIKLKYS